MDILTPERLKPFPAIFTRQSHGLRLPWHSSLIPSCVPFLNLTRGKDYSVSLVCCCDAIFVKVGAGLQSVSDPVALPANDQAVGHAVAAAGATNLDVPKVSIVI